MIDPTVRRAGADDAEALAGLEQQGRLVLESTRGGSRWLDTHEPIGDGWVRAVDDRIVFVAEIDDVPVGYVLADFDEDPMPIARIEQVYVRPEARQLGFGDELVAAVTALAKEHGAAYIEASALPGDRDTKNLYERAGITARLITVSKPL